MNCADRDADLLMLAHRQHDRVTSLRLRLHLALCPACRARLRRFEALSGALATTYRNPVLGVRALRTAPSRAWASFGLLAALLTFLGWVVASNAAASRVPPPSVPKEGCPVHAAPKLACPAHACHFNSANKRAI